MSTPLKPNSSGDTAGKYYTAPGANAEARAKIFNSVQPPERLGYKQYNCPWNANKGPFLGSSWPAGLGPVATNRPWTPFAASVGDASPGALPLPLTIDSTQQGFKFSAPPVFNMGGHRYEPSLPQKVGQLAAQYFGNSQNDFLIAPATKNDSDKNNIFYVPVKFDQTAPVTRLEGFSDWAATASITNRAGQSLVVTFAVGSPLAFVTFDKNTNYGCLSLSGLPDAGKPVRSWYPEGYKCQSRAGVTIELGGPLKVTLPKHVDLTLDINVGGWKEHAKQAVHKDDLKTDLANKLRSQFLTSSQLDAGNVEQSKQPDIDYQFLLTAKNPRINVNQDDVKASPTSGSEDAQIVLIPRTENPHWVSPPGDASVVGITVSNVYKTADPDVVPMRSYCASYAFIAPTGAKWVFDSKGQLVCDFTTAKTPTKTLIVCAMPTLWESDYEYYDDPGIGAAAKLRRFWEMMKPYAYGCPRSVNNDGTDNGKGTLLGPNDGNRFTPKVATDKGRTTVTTEFYFNLTYPAGRPAGAGGTLACLFPHQWRAYANNPASVFTGDLNSPVTYRTSVGPLHLTGCGDTPGKPAFTTTYAFPGMLAHLPNVAGLKGDEKLTVYDYPSKTAGSTTTLSLKDQMMRDTATPVWGADESKGPPFNTFTPILPSPQLKFGLGSYDWGKLVGLLGDLIQSARDLGNPDAQNAAIKQLNAQLGQWLSGGLVGADQSTAWPAGVAPWQNGVLKLETFAGPKGLSSNQQFLYYDQQWSTLIPYPTGFDAETLINDHHFHYGYWIRAAAQLALAQRQGLDPDNKATDAFISNYGATVNLIIKDIANPLRGDKGAIGDSAKNFPDGPAMPFMRYMDGYSGHSWASGLRPNVMDQESVSEAMSAWTGVIMWGEVTKDTRLRDLGIWMYIHEMWSFYEYWMDCSQNRDRYSMYYPPGSEQTVVGHDYDEAMCAAAAGSGYSHFFCHVFNGYRQMSTFFGWEPVHMAGIQWMPLHGGSLYLGSSDPSIRMTLGGAWKWCTYNSQFLWGNYKALLVSIKAGQDAAGKFIAELNNSINNGAKTNQITQGLRDAFISAGFKLATKEDEDNDKHTPKWRVIVTKVDDTHWEVDDFRAKKYAVEWDQKTSLLYIFGGKPLLSLKPGADADNFVKELKASVNTGNTNRITEGLRAAFAATGYALATKEDEDKSSSKERVIVTMLGSRWQVADFGAKTYTFEWNAKTNLWDISGVVGGYRPTLFATGWEPIAWGALAVIDPNCDQIYDPIDCRSAADIWAQVEKAVGSKGDPNITASGWKPEMGQAVSCNYYWIANSCKLGVRDASVGADYPFAVKFIGKRVFDEQRQVYLPTPITYVVWNMTGDTKTVTFSDGQTVAGVPPYKHQQFVKTV